MMTEQLLLYFTKINWKIRYKPTFLDDVNRSGTQRLYIKGPIKGSISNTEKCHLFERFLKQNPSISGYISEPYSSNDP